MASAKTMAIRSDGDGAVERRWRDDGLRSARWGVGRRGVAGLLPDRCRRARRRAFSSERGRLRNVVLAFLIAAVAVGAAGCLSAAKVRTVDGRTLRGTIVDSDATSIRLRRSGYPRAVTYASPEDDPAMLVLHREEILAIAHPGKGLMITGGVVAGVSAICIATILALTSGWSGVSYFDNPFSYGLFAIGIGGAAMFTVGLVASMESQQRAGMLAAQGFLPSVPSYALQSGPRPPLGLSLRGRF